MLRKYVQHLLLDPQPPSDGGGGAEPGALEEKEFQGKVLGGIEKLGSRMKEGEKSIATLLDNYDQLDKQTKSAMEEFTKIKNNLNSFAEAEQSLQKLQVQLKREQRMAYGDPLKRLLSDPERRTYLNAVFRNAVNHKLADVHAKALGEDSSPGSTIIDDDLATEIYDTLATFGVWNTFQVVRLGTKQTKFPVATARPVANFILTEGGTIGDDSTKAGTSVTCEVEVIACLLNVSLQLVQDAEVDVATMLMEDFIQAFNNRLDFAALAADGTADATNGGMTGVFEGGTAATAAGGNTTVETTDFEDWTKALLTVDPIVLNRAARWWLHPQILVRLLSVKDSNGRPIFLTSIEAPAPGSIGSILGYPVTPAYAAPSTNGASAKVAVFGDPRGQVIGMRQDWMFESSDHHKWDTNQRSFRGVGRAGNKIRRSQAFAVVTLAAA